MYITVVTKSGSMYSIVSRDDRKYITGGALGAHEGVIVELKEEIRVGNTLNLSYRSLNWYCQESSSISTLHTNIISEIVVNF